MVGCINYQTVNISVPGPGNVTVSAYTHYWIEHTAGTTDGFASMIRTTPGDCSLVFGLESTFAISEIPGAWATDTLINQELSVFAVFPVGAAGTYTYYLNTDMWNGESSGDEIVNGVMIVVYYPS